MIEHSIPLKYIPSFQYYPVIERRIPDKVLKKIKGTVAAIIYLEKQKDEKKLKEAIDTVIKLIKGEHPEQVRMFSVWLKRMFSNVFKSEEAEKLNQLTEVKSMLAQIAEKIEARGMQQGMQQKAKEAALKMKQKGFSEEDIAEITGLSMEEIRAL